MGNSVKNATLIRLLRGLVVVGLIVTVVGVGVYFYFSDVETSPGNKITAGTLDLTIQETAEIEPIEPNDWGRIDNPDTICTTPDPTTGEITCHVEISHVAPTDTGTIVWTLKNIGNLKGYLTVDADVTSDNGTDTEPELTAAEAYGSNPDLSYMVTTTLSGGSITEPQTASLSEVETKFDTQIDRPMDPDGEIVYTLAWELPNTGSTFDNLAQGDTATIDLTFYLEQVAGQHSTP